MASDAEITGLTLCGHGIDLHFTPGVQSYLFSLIERNRDVFIFHAVEIFRNFKQKGVTGRSADYDLSHLPVFPDA